MQILPHPVRLRDDVVALARRRWRTMLASALVAAMCAAVPAWTLVGLAREQAAWARATPIPARAHITSSGWGPFQVHRASALVGRGEDERLVVLGTLSLPSPVDETADEVRRDPQTGATMLEAFVAMAGLRRALAIAALVVLLLGAGTLGALALRRRADLSTMYRVASAPRARVVRCDARLGGRGYAFVLDEPAPAGYRENARRRRRYEVRLRDDEPPPLLLGREQLHLVIVMSEAGEGPVVLRSDLSPFALDSSQEREAREALARLTAMVMDPETPLDPAMRA